MPAAYTKSWCSQVRYIEVAPYFQQFRTHGVFCLLWTLCGWLWAVRSVCWRTSSRNQICDILNHCLSNSGLRRFRKKKYCKNCIRHWTNNLVQFSLLSHACHMPCPPHSPWLDLPNDIWGWVQIMKLLIVHLSQFSVTSSLLGPDILLRTLFSNTRPSAESWRIGSYPNFLSFSDYFTK
jgi:hypothetical protein